MDETLNEKHQKRSKEYFKHLGPLAAAAEAVEDWEEVLRVLSPLASDPQAGWPFAGLMQRLRALEKLGLMDALEMGFNDLRASHPQRPYAWRRSAHFAQAREDFQSAADLWHQFLAAFPDEPAETALVGLSVCLRRLGQAKEADACLIRLCRDYPGSWQGWAGLARLAFSQGRPRQAARFWKEAAARCEGTAPLAVQVGMIQANFALSDWRAAEIGIAALRESHSDNNRWKVLAIELCLMRGDLAGAVETVRGFAAMPDLAQDIPLDLLARISFEACLSHDQAEAWVQGQVDIRQARMARLPGSWQGVDHFRDTDAIAAHDAGMSKDWSQDMKLALRKYLANRTYPNYLRLLTIGCRFLPKQQIEALLSVGRARYPGADGVKKLEHTLNRDCPALPQGDPYGDFGPISIKAVPRPEVSIQADLQGLKWRRLVCVVMVRDEDEMLPIFMRHHLALGVESFIILDNASIRPPAEVLAPILQDWPEAQVTHIRTETSFIEAGSGMAWVNQIIDQGIADWVLFVDCDELLVYAGSDHLKLPALLDHLDSRGEEVVTGWMIDLYDEAYRQSGVTSDDFAAHKLFAAVLDSAGELRFPGNGVYNRKRPAGIISPTPNKCPLIKVSAGVHYMGNHWTTPGRVAKTNVILKHMKVYRDRRLVGLTANELCQHSRLRDRSIPQIARHVNVSAFEATEEFAHPFQMEFSEARLMRLGYLQADQAWRTKIGSSLPRDRKGPALALRGSVCRGNRFGAFNFPFADAAMTEVLQHMVSYAKSGQRAALRGLLSAQTARLAEHPEVARALLMAAAALLGRKAAAVRLLRGTLAALRRAESSFIDPAHDVGRRAASVPALCAIADVLVDFRDLSQPLLNAIATESGSKATDHRLATCRATHLLLAGQSRRALALLSGFDPSRTPQGFFTFADACQRLRDWDQHRAAAERAFVSPAIPVHSRLLTTIAHNPDADWRTRAYEMLLARTFAEVAEGRAAVLAVHCALLHLRGRSAEMAEVLAQHGARLDPRAFEYFSRLVAVWRGLAPPAKLGRRFWGLGLSRTGTSSLADFGHRLGLVTAHWVNPYLGTLIDAQDTAVFDLVCDTPAAYCARILDKPDDVGLIVTTRSFPDWEISFLRHFALEFDGAADVFTALKHQFEDEIRVKFGPNYKRIIQELYTRFETLREAYDYQKDWIASLRASGRPILDLPLELPDTEKVVRLRDFMGLSGPLPVYPHVNRAHTVDF